MEAFYGLLEEEREALCGPRYERSGSRRRAYRHGHETGRLVLGGRRMQVRRPRVRSVQGEELTLPSWEMASCGDPLDQRAVEQVLCGVATRSYERSLEPPPAELPTSGTSRSAVSRRFVARTRERLAQALSCPLDRDYPVILLDGVVFGESVLVVALGIDREGHKQVLGVVEGSTENEAVGHRLLSGLIERGLAVERARLFIIDGGKGLRRAIRSCFGQWALVQRCQVHKMVATLGK
jgi:transposase-like protein